MSEAEIDEQRMGSHPTDRSVNSHAPFIIRNNIAYIRVHCCRSYVEDFAVLRFRLFDDIIELLVV